MTVTEFLSNFYCQVSITNPDGINLVVISKAIKRSDNSTVDQVSTTIRIQEASTWIADSNTQVSLDQLSWDNIIEQAKRAQLDYFAQRAHIQNYYPLNSSTDITNMYE